MASPRGVKDAFPVNFKGTRSKRAASCRFHRARISICLFCGLGRFQRSPKERSEAHVDKFAEQLHEGLHDNNCRKDRHGACHSKRQRQHDQRVSGRGAEGDCPTFRRGEPEHASNKPAQIIRYTLLSTYALTTSPPRDRLGRASACMRRLGKLSELFAEA